MAFTRGGLSRHHQSIWPPVFSPTCVAEDSRYGEGFQVFHECRGPRLQLASRSFLPRARRCGQAEVPDQLTLRTSRSVVKPVMPSLDELCLYSGEAEAAPQFCRWHAISASHVYNAVGTVEASQLTQLLLSETFIVFSNVRGAIYIRLSTDWRISNHQHLINLSLTYLRHFIFTCSSTTSKNLPM